MKNELNSPKLPKSLFYVQSYIRCLGIGSMWEPTFLTEIMLCAKS